MSTNDMGFFIPTSEANALAWDAYRTQFKVHRTLLLEYMEALGAKSVWTHEGQITGIKASGRDSFHKAFSAKVQRNGARYRIKRGRTAEEIAAVAQLAEMNLLLAEAWPQADKLAMSHGFITSIGYKTRSGGEGWRAIGSMFNPFQPLWLSDEGPVVLYAPDAARAIQQTLEPQPDYSDSGAVETTPATWSVPEGYKQISEARWNFMKAQYELAEEEKENRP